MADILNTNFAHDQEQHEPTIDPSAPYTLFEPIVEHVNADGTHERLDRETVLAGMKKYVEALEIEPGFVVPLGAGESHTLGEVVDTHGEKLLTELNGQIPTPDEMTGIVDTVAKLAERSGFDREKAVFRGSFMYERQEGNPNLNVHSDGLGNLVAKGHHSIKKARFVYALGHGTLAYPHITDEGLVSEVDYDSPTGISTVENPTPEQELSAPRTSDFTEKDLIEGGAQQVMPGVILGFDPTRTFWHQAPSEDRPILVFDVDQAE